MELQDIPSFLIKHIANNHVSSVTGYTFRMKEGRPDGYGYKSFYQEYRQGDGIQKSESYNPAHFCIREEYFDPSGKLLKVLVYNDNKTLNYFLEYQYDSVGLKEKTMYLADHSLWLKHTIVLDNGSRTVREITTNKDGELIQESAFQYDSNGNLVAIDKGMGGKLEYRYDGSGCLTALDIFAPSASRKGDYFLFFYEDNLLLRQVIHNDDEMTIFEYVRMAID